MSGSFVEQTFAGKKTVKGYTKEKFVEKADKRNVSYQYFLFYLQSKRKTK